jgi:Tfp pilus assembly protein PilE
MAYSNERGIGLLQVITACAIIAVIVIVAYNEYGPGKEKQLAELCHTNMKALQWAEKLYYRQHQAYTTDLNDLQGYIEDIDVIRCPEDNSPYIIELTEFGFSIREGGTGDHGSITDGLASWDKIMIYEETEEEGEEQLQEPGTAVDTTQSADPDRVIDSAGDEVEDSNQ